MLKQQGSKKELFKSAVEVVMETNRNTPPPDPLGQCIVQLMAKTDFDQAAQHTFHWTPLFSLHNANYVVHCLQRFFSKRGNEKEQTKRRTNTSPPRPSWKNEGLFFLRVTSILFLVTFVFLAQAMVWMAQTLYYLTMYTLVLLVDVESLPYIPTLVERSRSLLRWFNNVVLQGNRYKGREWTDTESFALEHPERAASCTTSLLELPPPQLPPSSSASATTTQHLKAIQYCHKMLLENQKREKERRRRKALENMSAVESQRLAAAEHDGTLVTHSFRKDSENMVLSPREEFELRMNASDESTVMNCVSPTQEKELAWIDVGAKIGMRLLHSEHVQRAMSSQETTDRFLETIHSSHERSVISPPRPTQAVSKPVHSMWTSPTVEHPPHVSPRKKSIKLPKASAPKPPCIRRQPLEPGMKITVPFMPLQPSTRSRTSSRPYQMATVASSKRIYVGDDTGEEEESNCLSVTVKLEKSFLRNGAFADLTFRVMDHWSARYMPRHSKVPIGSCVATAFGIGVLVGWRVNDDCHILRSLWSSQGHGSSHAFLHRDAIYSTVEAAVGFHVLTPLGWGVVLACTNTRDRYEHCQFQVTITDVGDYTGRTLNMKRRDILSCPGAQFMPVIEHVRAAALYQIQVDQYNAVLRGQKSRGDQTTEEQEFLLKGSICAEILWNSFLKAIEEDSEFDTGLDAFVTSLSQFLDRLDQKHSDEEEEKEEDCESPSSAIEQTHTFESGSDEEIEVQLAPPGDAPDGSWIMNDLFDGFFRGPKNENSVSSPAQDSEGFPVPARVSGYDRAFAVLKTVMKTVSIARAVSVEQPHFRLALAISYDFLLFLRTIVKIQQRNDSVDALSVFRRAGREIKSTFGPIKERIESIGRGIAIRMEHQGRMAKARVLKLFDIVLNDELLIAALEQGEWEKCSARVEIALVETEIIDESKLLYYRKAARFIHGQVRLLIGGEASAATRNSEKLMLLGALLQACAAPRRSILKFFLRDDMLELFERILVRAYHKEEVATRMLTIHAANFHSLRHLRMLKDFSVAGRIWIPLLDAADEEFTWLVSKMPEKSKGILCPLSSLFSLCVAQFHRINAGDLSKDWLAFLLEEDSVNIIHDLNMRLILALESFSQDIKEMMMVLPYYPSIDVDILNLMDEINIDEFVQEASEVLDDPEKLSGYIREKATIGIERFLNYLPKMSIPVEKRDLGDGWILSCHGKEGGGLTLTDVTIKRENVVCQVMGGDTLFFPMFDDAQHERTPPGDNGSDPAFQEEESVLHHIRSLLINAQEQGAWEDGVGGVCQLATDRYAAAVLHGIPVSSVLNCSIELWRNLEIDDDELLEIAIRDISYHIQLQNKLEEDDGSAGPSGDQRLDTPRVGVAPEVFAGLQGSVLSTNSFSESQRRRFNPRADPTILHLQIRRLTLNVDNFVFRIEKAARTSIFDPVLEGQGRLSLQSISIRVRVECAKEKARRSPLGADVFTPVFQLRDFDVSLEKLQMTVTDTGFGSDWILNKAVSVFEDKLTEIVEVNLRDQIKEQLVNIVDSLNSYFLLNPALLLNILGVSIDDLDESLPE